jgi:broad specificity phosphatase PhoE
MQTLIVARHAFALSNRDALASCVVPGDGLTPEGVEQGRRLRAELEGEPFDLGVSSALLRTQETLELALDGNAAPRVVVPELNEIHFGSFDGGLMERYRTWAAAESPSVPAPGGGESRAQAAGRYARALRVVLARPEARILLVGHALAIRYVLDAARGLPPAPLIVPVEHATPHRLDAGEVAAAASLLEQWSRSPRFRDPSTGGPGAPAAGRRSSR